jgi:hypothetical protein
MQVRDYWQVDDDTIAPYGWIDKIGNAIKKNDSLGMEVAGHSGLRIMKGTESRHQRRSWTSESIRFCKIPILAGDSLSDESVILQKHIISAIIWVMHFR